MLSRREFIGAGCCGSLAVWSGWGPGRARLAIAGNGRQAVPPESRDVERMLREKILAAWYPRCLDTTGGGFHQHYDEAWNRLPTRAKFIVYQSRMTWVPAAVAVGYPDRQDPWLGYVRHGIRYLRETMWDRVNGGFLEWVDEAGRPDPRYRPWKQMYGQAFGLYAAADAYRATQDRQTLDLAIDAFRWMEQHAHDDLHGGYFELLTAEGKPIDSDVAETSQGALFPLVGRIGEKSMNAHIHILEALTALAGVWTDPLLTERLTEVFLIVRDKIVRPEGHLAMFSDRRYHPLDERSSFGHELETAYLLVEAAERLGRTDHRRTHQVALTLVDHSLRWGWDKAGGGFFDEGPPTGRATKRGKVWWVQAEALNGLLTADRVAREDKAHGSTRYFQDFVRSWAFFRDKVVDHKHGGTFAEIEENGLPHPEKRAKASQWKAAYHVVRALLFTAATLKK